MNASKKTFEEALDELGSASRASSQEERGKVLTVLYQEFTKRYLSDNNRIWTTAATMVPLSLGAFALLASIDKPTMGQIIAFPLSGWLLMSFWFVVADNHRRFQERNEEWLKAIQKEWGFELVPEPKRRILTVRRSRIALWWIVTVATVAAILLWPGGVLV
jgi:hypothetical protein